MHTKEQTAMNELLSLLEARYATRVLWSLRDGHKQTFRLLQDSVGNITPNTLNTRLKELRAAHLIDQVGGGYFLTPAGLDLIKRLHELQAFANKWQASQEAAASTASHTP